MEPLQFKEIRDLLNACRLTTLDEKPTQSEKGHWELYRGNYRAHVIDVPFKLLYVLADATRESIKKAARVAYTANETFVVYAPSNKNKAALREEFGSARGFWSTTEYLASFMSHELDAYRKALANLSPSYYVDPVVQPPSGTEHRYPNPIQLFLTDPETAEEREGRGSVAVVLAEAGHGKTFMCESLVARLATKNAMVLPIFVSSAQWQRLRTEDMKSLGTTILSSFRELGTPIPWVEGQEDLFLKVALKTGLFRIVFDGFDEYVLRMPGGVSASETLAALASLAKETGTRVVITSRTSFWKAEISDYQNGIESKLEQAGVFVYHLQPFDANLARNYFQLRFKKDNQKIERAVAIFRDLSKDDPSFAGRGFVLLLVADLVDSGEELSGTSSSEKPLIRLMHAHCDRERKRHKLPISSKQQMDILKHFVFEVSQGEEPASALLTLSIQMVADDLAEEDVKATVQKMMPHALIEGRQGRWTIRQPQVEIALLAMQLMEYADSGTTALPVLSRFSRSNLAPGTDSDLGAMLASLCYWGRSRTDAFQRVKELISLFYRASSASLEDARSQVLRRLSTLIALRIVEQEAGQSHRERASMLADLLPSGTYKDVVFFGGLARFDWSGHTFESCIFDNVRWSNCEFDGNTIFRGCHLVGGSTQYCKNFSDIQWIDCSADDAGRQFKDTESIRAGKKAYSEEFLKTEVSNVLEKFLGKGGIGFKSVGQADLTKGKIAMSPHKNQIIDGLQRFILDEHHISGQEKKALNIKEEAKDAVRALFANNIWTGSLADLLENLKRRIGIPE